MFLIIILWKVFFLGIIIKYIIYNAIHYYMSKNIGKSLQYIIYFYILGWWWSVGYLVKATLPICSSLGLFRFWLDILPGNHRKIVFSCWKTVQVIIETQKRHTLNVFLSLPGWSWPEETTVLLLLASFNIYHGVPEYNKCEVIIISILLI